MYRIAFFGSDLFSLASFQALHALQRQRPELVSDLCLCTRQLKPSGRGMRSVAIPDIVSYSRAQNVSWYEVETNADFAALQDQRRHNLAVAVSFGRLIPAPYLHGLAFGGLNVHPSLLPQYRGSSPLQAAIMNLEKKTGVSIQTLHPTLFDRGDVLSQTEVALDARETTPTLSNKLAEIGARDLVQVIAQQDLRAYTALAPRYAPSFAVKLRPQLASIDFGAGWEQNDARGRALGKLYFHQELIPDRAGKKGSRQSPSAVRVNLAGFEVVGSVDSADPAEAAAAPPGTLWSGVSESGAPVLAVKVADGFLGARLITVQNQRQESVTDYFASRAKRGLGKVLQGRYSVL